MPTVTAEAEVAIDPEAAVALWTDLERWATFVEGFARVLERNEAWPGEGGRIVWESNPHGRGRVTEKVVERRPGLIRSQIFEQRLTGTQTARFDGGRFGLQLEYVLTGNRPLQGLTDVLFVRRALRDSLRRTVRRFAVEAEEEAGLR